VAAAPVANATRDRLPRARRSTNQRAGELDCRLPTDVISRCTQSV
jgi:hypothetical protein